MRLLAVQIVTDAPHGGGLSGCALEEARSWGKVAKDTPMETCRCDTIGMPFIVSGRLEQAGLVRSRRRPRLGLGRELTIEP